MAVSTCAHRRVGRPPQKRIRSVPSMKGACPCTRPHTNKHASRPSPPPPPKKASVRKARVKGARLCQRRPHQEPADAEVPQPPGHQAGPEAAGALGLSARVRVGMLVAALQPGALGGLQHAQRGRLSRQEQEHGDAEQDRDEPLDQEEPGPAVPAGHAVHEQQPGRQRRADDLRAARRLSPGALDDAAHLFDIMSWPSFCPVSNSESIAWRSGNPGAGRQAGPPRARRPGADRAGRGCRAGAQSARRTCERAVADATAAYPTPSSSVLKKVDCDTSDRSQPLR